MKYYKYNLDIRQANDEEVLDNEWVEITEEEYNRCLEIHQQITELKYQLKLTDYKALKYAEGCYTEEEYAPIKAHRQELRDRINELKNDI